MIGITAISGILGSERVSNSDRISEFDLDPSFLEEKLGIQEVARASQNEDSFSLGLAATEELIAKQGIDVANIEAIICVTQTPGHPIPHVSARLHGALDVPDTCACFDISLGCSGYVYAINIAKSFMEANGMRNGILVTSDPYSKIVDSGDKNTTLLFGDGATATLLSTDAVFEIGRSTFHTRGKDSKHLQSGPDGVLTMNGRAVFTFCAQAVPLDIKDAIELNQLSLEEIDKFIVHQGSKFIVDTIRGRLGLTEAKMPFLAADYGNTVSSSIPLILRNEMENPEQKVLLLSGFGVGLSWGSTILRRKKETK